jgi:outer membrane lipase/esterase
LGTADAATLTGISVAFNASLHAAIATWRALDPGLTILEFDTFDALRNVTSNPAAFGLTNVSDPCFTGVTVCGDPSQYLYWDSLHPSASGHQILGQALTVAVAAAPEPPIGALMVLAGMGALAARRIGSLRMCCS